MRWETWLFFIITDGVMSLTPGPAVLFVLSQAIRRGASKSVWGSCGILTANAVYFALSATSLGAIILASSRIFFMVKWLGAGYLIYLGLRNFFGKTSVLALPEATVQTAGGWRIFRDGFLLQGANPKALLFFTAILPQFIDPKGAVAFQVFILGTSSILLEFIILFTYGQLAGRALPAARNPRFEAWTNRIAGSLLIAAGVGLARLGRT